MWLCARSRTVYTNPITSGMSGQYTETPTGRYHIQGRNTDTVLTLNTGATYDVKYWIPFDAPLFGFHDSSWQHFPYGSPQYKTDGSHGCIHMPLEGDRVPVPLGRHRRGRLDLLTSAPAALPRVLRPRRRRTLRTRGNRR